MLFYTLARLIARILIHTVARVHLEGASYTAQPAPFILATNHLTSWDPPLIFAIWPPPAHLTVLAADKWRKVLPILWLFNAMGAIWVKRGEVDRAALRACVDALKHGGAMGMSPEGTRSRTGGLQQGRSGVVYLALKAGAPVIPVALWGVEQIGRNIRRLRRSDVYLRIGAPMIMDPALSLDENTEHLMRTIAEMLPEQYRGVYGGKRD
ncbi:MAG: 1-acyl-sn-glycerol-3-phosphate acyltransferase [Chloroflexi bacterium]|nr:1-acyl-sn-glycerol-3-phosphate acyltransferase [Chloroflexota bacterium]MCL5274090.1 1-acyl-sn-glycerol-3-phosphate acyltransferase [Chloroflexota bacterium]